MVNSSSAHNRVLIVQKIASKKQTPVHLGEKLTTVQLPFPRNLMAHYSAGSNSKKESSFPLLCDGALEAFQLIATTQTMSRLPDPGFSQLVQNHYVPLRRFAHSLTRNATDASDLTQETFLIWAQRGHQLRDPTKAKTWLFTTLYREHLRVRRRGTGLIALEELPPLIAEPTEHNQLDAQTVLAALQTLPNDYRIPLVLFYLQERSYRQIADRLSLPIGTVMNRLYRGKQRLRLAVSASSS